MKTSGGLRLDREQTTYLADMIEAHGPQVVSIYVCDMCGHRQMVMLPEHAPRRAIVCACCTQTSARPEYGSLPR